MVYSTAIILLAKPFVRETQRTSSQQSTEAHAKLQTNPFPKAEALSLDAAKQICTLGDQYREVFGSFRQSPITATHCTLSALLTLLSRDEGGGKPEMDRIRSGLLTLKGLSISWMPARRYHNFILKMLQERKLEDQFPRSLLLLPELEEGTRATGPEGKEKVATERGNSDPGSDQVVWPPYMELDPTMGGFLGQIDMFTWMDNNVLADIDNVPFGENPIWDQPTSEPGRHF